MKYSTLSRYDLIEKRQSTSGQNKCKIINTRNPLRMENKMRIISGKITKTFCSKFQEVFQLR